MVEEAGRTTEPRAALPTVAVVAERIVEPLAEMLSAGVLLLELLLPLTRRKRYSPKVSSVFEPKASGAQGE
jgi:hypothetical protein